MNKQLHFADWYASLNENDLLKIKYLEFQANWDSEEVMMELENKFYLKSELGNIPRSGKENIAFLTEELSIATNDLLSPAIPINWDSLKQLIREFKREVSMSLEEDLTSNQEDDYDHNDPPDINDSTSYSDVTGMTGLFIECAYLAGLADEYLKLEYLEYKELPYNFALLRDYDKVIEIIGKAKWIARLVYLMEFGSQKPNKNKRKPIHDFDKIFRREHRKSIPQEVLRLLGPGEADAWKLGRDNTKQWVYNGPQNSVITPFHILCELGYIEVNSREKKAKITAWLNEFNVKYKPKTFDYPSKGLVFDYFYEYLNKLKQNNASL